MILLLTKSLFLTKDNKNNKLYHICKDAKKQNNLEDNNQFHLNKINKDKKEVKLEINLVIGEDQLIEIVVKNVLDFCIWVFLQNNVRILITREKTLNEY